MKTKQLKTKQLTSLTSWGDCCQLASDLYGTADRCDGNRAERFIAGWVNSADMIDDGELDENDWEAVKPFVLSEVLNYEPKLLS